MKKQYDSWMGSMSSAQKKELEKFTSQNPSPVNEIIYQRQALAHEFIKVHPDKAARKQFVEKLFTQYESLYEPGFSKVSKERNAKVVKNVTAILNMMSDDQRKVLVETLRDRANQLKKISL